MLILRQQNDSLHRVNLSFIGIDAYYKYHQRRSTCLICVNLSFIGIDAKRQVVFYQEL